jgi:hypothetical protein
MSWFLVRDSVNFESPYNRFQVGQVFPGRIDDEPFEEVRTRDIATRLDIYQNVPVKRPEDHECPHPVHECERCRCDPEKHCAVCNGEQEFEDIHEPIWLTEKVFIHDWVWITSHFGPKEVKMRHDFEVVPVEWDWIMDVYLRGEFRAHRLARKPSKLQRDQMHYIRSRGLSETAAKAMVGLCSFEPSDPKVREVLNRKSAHRGPIGNLRYVYG